MNHLPLLRRSLALAPFLFGLLAGCGDMVKASNPELDDRVRELFDESARRIDAITPTFGEAISGSRGSINSAMTVLRALRDALDTEVRAAIVKWGWRGGEPATLSRDPSLCIIRLNICRYRRDETTRTEYV